MAEIKVSTYDEFKTAFPKVLEKKMFFAKDYSRVLVTYAEKAGVCFVMPHSQRSGYLVKAFNWNAKNDVFYHYYETAAAAEAKANYFLNAKTKHLANVAERRSERSKGHDLKLGDILYASWGYDQTNIDYYKVVKTTKCTVDLVSIPKVRLAADRVKPNTSASAATMPVHTKKRVGAYGYVKIDSSRRASKCEPTDTHYETPFGFGH